MEPDSHDDKLLAQEVKQIIGQLLSTLVNEHANRPPPASKSETLIASSNVDDEDEDEANKDMVTLRNLQISPPPKPPQQQQQQQQQHPQQQLQQPSSDETSKTNGKDTVLEAVSNQTERISVKRKLHNNTDNNNLNNSANETNNTLNNGAANNHDQSMTQEAETGRSKRRRTQTRLFQAGDVEQTTATAATTTTTTTPNKPATTANLAQATKATIHSERSKQDPASSTSQDVIFYEKNDYLAIRNEENSFFLCQLVENVRKDRPLIKIKWLDTNDGGETYMLTNHFDKIPLASIIMPVTLNKLKGETKNTKLFSLDNQFRDQVMERLKRSLDL